MKFSIEFTSMRDFLTSFPKLATLISGDGSPEERFAAALAGELEPMTIKVTPTDGKPLTDSEKEGVKDAIAEALTKTRGVLPAEPAQKPAEKAAPKPTASTDKPKKEKAAESTPEPKKPAQGATGSEEKVSGADVRAAFNNLLKNDRRDAVKKILKRFGAANFSGLAEKDYAAAIEASKKYLQMSNEEYAKEG